jgi:hypothetical protein
MYSAEKYVVRKDPKRTDPEDRGGEYHRNACDH